MPISEHSSTVSQFYDGSVDLTLSSEEHGAMNRCRTFGVNCKMFGDAKNVALRCVLKARSRLSKTVVHEICTNQVVVTLQAL